VEADVKNYKSAAEAARDIGRGIAAMRQTHRGPMLLVVQVCCVHNDIMKALRCSLMITLTGLRSATSTR
jgi:hypothetical protein